MTQKYRTAGVKFTSSSTHKAKRERGLLISSVDILAVFVLFFFASNFVFSALTSFVCFFLSISYSYSPFLCLSSSYVLCNIASNTSATRVQPHHIFFLLLLKSFFSVPNYSSCSVMSYAKIIGDLMHSWYSAHIL